MSTMQTAAEFIIRIMSYREFYEIEELFDENNFKLLWAKMKFD